MSKDKRYTFAILLLCSGYALFVLCLFFPIIHGMSSISAIFHGFAWSGIFILGLLKGNFIANWELHEFDFHEYWFMIYQMVAPWTNIFLILSGYAAQRIYYEGKMRWYRVVMSLSGLLIISPFLVQTVAAGSNEYIWIDFRRAEIGYHFWWLSHSLLAVALWLLPTGAGKTVFKTT